MAVSKRTFSSMGSVAGKPGKPGVRPGAGVRKAVRRMARPVVKKR
jgi:hypothetical protein